MSTRGNPEPENVTAEAIASALMGVRVAGVGIVESYDAATQTATIQPAVRRPVETEEGDVVQEQDSPVQNVMVGHMGSSALSMHTVLAQGDAVLLVYLDYSPAMWRRRGQVSDTPHTHAHQVPVAIPFFRPLGAAGADLADSLGTPGGLRIHFTAEVITVGAAAGDGDFVALKSAVDNIQQNLDAMASFGTPFGPTVPGNLAPAGAQTSSTKLKA